MHSIKEVYLKITIHNLLQRFVQLFMKNSDVRCVYFASLFCHFVLVVSRGKNGIEPLLDGIRMVQNKSRIMLTLEKIQETQMYYSQ